MPKPPKPVTRRRLEGVARRYLERWFTARAHLERLLIRRVDRALEAHGGDREEALAWVSSILDDLEREGHLNDARFAADRARLLQRRGASTRAITAKLSVKGVAREQITDAVGALGPPSESDLRAAAALVRKRRMGPYRADPASARERDLARLARAGFSYGIALRVLDQPTPDDVEALELGLGARRA